MQGSFLFRQRAAVAQHRLLAEHRRIRGGNAFRIPTRPKAGQGLFLEKDQAGAFLSQSGQLLGLVPAARLALAQFPDSRMQPGQGA